MIDIDIECENNLLEEHANNGIYFAQYLLAYRYENGEKVRKDLKLAKYWYGKSAESKKAVAIYKYAYHLAFGDEESRDCRKAMALLVSIAAEHPASYYVIGELYFFGQGFKKNLKKAYKNYCKGASCDCSDSQVRVGQCYLNGWGTEKNYHRAKVAFENNSNPSEKRALFFLGLIHEMGFGVEKSYQISRYYYQRAALLGCIPSLGSLGIYYYSGKHGKINYEKALHFGNEAAKKGYKVSQLMLALMYANGLGVEECGHMFDYWRYRAGIGTKEIY